MSASNPAFLAFLEKQRIDYRRSLPGRMAEMETLWCKVLNEAAPAEALVALERHAHSLAGSSATFGLAAFGDAARALEEALSPWVESAGAPTPSAQADVGHALEALQRSLPGEPSTHDA